MKKINIYLSLLTLVSVVTIVERLSPTTHVFLQPYNFLRLHEVIQTLILLLASMILPFVILKELSNNFSSLKTQKGTILAVIFVAGVYLYAAGEGGHEMASHLFNSYCNTKVFQNQMCGALFFNDYYFWNVVFFLGSAFTTIALILIERMNPRKNVTRYDLIIAFINSIIFGLMYTAYTAFDRVLVGFAFATILAVISSILLLSSKQKPIALPFTLYSTTTYIFIAVLTFVIRLGRHTL